LFWPLGLTFMSVFFFLHNQGWWASSAIICGMYLLCGLRFIFGWFSRGYWKKEDSRWGLWRERWTAGKGWLKIHSAAVNFFFFYHSQSMANVIFASLPLHIVVTSIPSSQNLRLLEWIAIILWVVSFTLENVADYQLNSFKLEQMKLGVKGGVMRSGLWRYSRHPNYFFEFMVWVSYAIFSIPSISQLWQALILAMEPYVMYYFLVHFTGIYISEEHSLKVRGAAYRDYQLSTSAFFPYFPKHAQ